MILPQGITGFDVPRDRTEADPMTFRADCWHVAIARHGCVEDRQQVLDARYANFITQVLVLPRIEITAVLNKVYPWLAFCRPLEPGNCSLEFVDPPSQFVTSFAELGRYRVVSCIELDEPVSEAMCAELGHSEMHQLKYWSDPVKLRVGQVVFNFWD